LEHVSVWLTKRVGVVTELSEVSLLPLLLSAFTGPNSLLDAIYVITLGARAIRGCPLGVAALAASLA
jgi:hypothetical protein